MQENFVLKAKKAIKKVAAVSTGVAMLGATMTGALAADLADYPAPFVVNGVPDASMLIALGDISAASDTIGATDIALGLQNAAKTASGGGTTVSVSGGAVSEKIPLNKGIADATIGLDANIEDDDVSSLIDGTVTFQSADYDVREVVVFGTASPIPETSLTSASAVETDYGSDIFLEATRDAIKYYYAFDESINVSKATTSNPLEIKFLGKTMKITDVDSADFSKFTARVGTEYFMDVGDSVVVNNKKVTLNNVGSGGSISIDVDGVVEIISSGGTETVNGIEITNDETFYEDVKTERSASLIIGKDAQETYKDGDAYVGEDTNDPNWIWNTGALQFNAATTVPANTGTADSTTAPYIGIENDFIYNDASDNPPGIGECIDLPNNYVSICLDSLTVSDSDYAKYTLEYESSADFSDVAGAFANQTSEPAIRFYTSVDDGLRVEGDHIITNTTNSSTDIKTKEIWFSINNSNNTWIDVFYKNKDDGKIKYQGAWNQSVANENYFMTVAYIQYSGTKDTNMVLRNGQGTGATGATPSINLTFDIVADSTNDLADDVDDINTQWTLSNEEFNRLGATQSSEEAAEVQWGNANTSIGTKDSDLRTAYGVIIKDPKANGGSDKVEVMVPSDIVEANIVVKGTTGTSTSGASSYTINPLPDPVTVMESEIAGAESAHNLIIVGGPAVNKLAEKFLAMTADDARATYSAGEAVLKIATNGDKIALVVFGYNADDTRRAAKVLQNYGSFTLSGTEALVKGTSLEVADITVS